MTQNQNTHDLRKQRLDELVDKIYELSDENARLRTELKHYHHLLCGILIGAVITILIYGVIGGG